jgi:hypothetical protein
MRTLARGLSLRQRPNRQVRSHERVGRALFVTETPKELAKETQQGRSERTPWLALTGVTMAVGAIVLAILVAALLVYYLV